MRVGTMLTLSVACCVLCVVVFGVCQELPVAVQQHLRHIDAVVANRVSRSMKEGLDALSTCRSHVDCVRVLIARSSVPLRVCMRYVYVYVCLCLSVCVCACMCMRLCIGEQRRSWTRTWRLGSLDSMPPSRTYATLDAAYPVVLCAGYGVLCCGVRCLLFHLVLTCTVCVQTVEKIVSAKMTTVRDALQQRIDKGMNDMFTKLRDDLPKSLGALCSRLIYILPSTPN